MKLKMVALCGGATPRYSRMIELPFVPPEKMGFDLENYEGMPVRGIVNSSLTHNFETGVTTFWVNIVDFSGREDIVPDPSYFEKNGWSKS